MCVVCVCVCVCVCARLRMCMRAYACTCVRVQGQIERARTLAFSPNSFWKMPNVPGPHTSCVMSLSQSVQVLSPGRTEDLPDFLARIFSVMVIACLTCKRGRGGLSVPAGSSYGTLPVNCLVAAHSWDACHTVQTLLAWQQGVQSPPEEVSLQPKHGKIASTHGAGLRGTPGSRHLLDGCLDLERAPAPLHTSWRHGILLR
jgi:hypothetical protein